MKLNYFIFYLFQFTNITDPATDIQCKREKECDADIIHACGIDKIKEQNVLVKFVNCSLVEAPKNNNTIPLETVIKFIYLISLKLCNIHIILCYYIIL